MKKVLVILVLVLTTSGLWKTTSLSVQASDEIYPPHPITAEMEQMSTEK